MKLYTITATPVRSIAQLKEPELGKLDFRARDIDSINKQAIAEYPKVVSDILKGWGIDGFTIYQVQGYWKGEAEVSFKIEIATDMTELSVCDMADELRRKYNQEAVMLTKPNNEVEFI